jgi:gas vesicle protein
MSEGRGASGVDVLLAFLAGAAAGAVVALLTTPRTGREMRESVGSWARRNGAGDAVAAAIRALRDAFDAGGDAQL